MEIRTCEEYVLAELEEWKRRAEAAESDRNAMGMLKQIFSVEDDPEGGLRIGVRDELLDVQKDPGALARIVLLKNLFGNGQEFDIAALLGGSLVKAEEAPEVEVKED